MKLSQEKRSCRENFHKTYYEDLIAASEITEVAQELMPERISEDSADKLYCDCPIHTSISKRSLHVDKTKQLWRCWDVTSAGTFLHLVEFIRAGRVSTGIKGPQPDSHRKARDYLAERAGMSLLGKSDLTAEEVGRVESRRVQDSRTFSCLTAVAEYYHRRLKLCPDVFEWLVERYAISEAAISNLKIGFSDNDPNGPGLIDELKSQGYTDDEILSTGAFVKSATGLLSFFQGRITFPYWSRGKGVVYMIARQTPWTPETEYETGKYKKLLVHSDRNPHVGDCINNSVLYNEDCLTDNCPTLIVTEGVTDAIAAMDRGLAVISPVTVRLKKADQQRLCDKLLGFQGRVVIVQDNEISRAGLKGAMDTATCLSRNGLDVRIAELHLDERHESARKALLDQYGIDADTPKADRDNKIMKLPDSEKKMAAALLEASKIDLNDYFKAGHTPEDFQEVLDAALDPIEVDIAYLVPELTGIQRSRALDRIFAEIVALDPTRREFYLKKIKARLGDTSLEALKRHLAKVALNSTEECEEDKTRFEKLLDLFHSSGSHAFTDQYGCGWATMRIADHWENVKIGTSRFIRIMLDAYMTTYDEPIAVESIKLVGELLTARATETRHLHNRYAWLGDRLQIDMCSSDWSVIEVTAGGWSIIQPEQPVFKRFSHQRPMPAPERGGDVKTALKYLPVRDDGNQALLLVWLCTCMLEFAPRPGLIIHGLQGSAKTTAAEFLRWIVDPSITLTHSLSRDVTEFVQLMDHHAVISLDNLSKLPVWASDALCRSTTGGGYQKRMLYTDDDDVTYHFRRVFILNGISVPAAAPDLLDRSISIELGRICRKDRKKISALHEAFEKDLPKILGGILDVMVEVVARKDEDLDEHPRLADWYGLARIAAEVLGVQDAFVKAFNCSDAEQHREVLESHVVSEILLEFLEGKDSWNGEKCELYAELTKIAEDRKIRKQWPTTVSVFGRKLKQLSHNLTEIGIDMTDYKEDNRRKMTITKTDTTTVIPVRDSLFPAKKVSGFAGPAGTLLYNPMISMTCPVQQ